MLLTKINTVAGGFGFLYPRNPSRRGDDHVHPKTLILHVDAYEATDHRIAFALKLAKKLDAHVMGHVYALEQVMPPMMMGDIPIQLIKAQQEQAERHARAAETTFKEASEAEGVSHESAIASGTLDAVADHFAEQARVADLAIVGQYNPDTNDPLKTPVIESVLFNSGRPMMIVPYIGAQHGDRFKQAIVGWDGGATGARAAFDALPLLAALKMSIQLVTVSRGTDSAERERSANAFIETAKRHGLEGAYQMIPGDNIDPANALLNDAAERDADLLVMGGYGHSRARELLFGGTTRELLSSMTLPVLMSH